MADRIFKVNPALPRQRMGIGKKGGVKKGQSTLEMALAFIVIVLLVGGIVKIWLWSNQQIVERQLRYNATRVQAGTGSDSYQTVWPVYKPGELKEGEVLISK